MLLCFSAVSCYLPPLHTHTHFQVSTYSPVLLVAEGAMASSIYLFFFPPKYSLIDHFSFCLKGRKRENHKEVQRDLPPTDSISDTFSSRGWARLQPRAGSSCLACGWEGIDYFSCQVLSPRLCTQAGSWSWKQGWNWSQTLSYWMWASQAASTTAVLNSRPIIIFLSSMPCTLGAQWSELHSWQTVIFSLPSWNSSAHSCYQPILA